MSETIEDIISEKRTTARKIRSRIRDQFGRELADMLDKEADRLEKAARNATMLCHQACSCELLAKNAKLRALVGELADALLEMTLLGCIVCTVQNKTE